MLHWLVIFVGIAIVAGLLGFRGVASASWGIAEFILVLIAIFVIVVVIAVFATGII
jgi:uncharacterized membrane protein YtjA (UPF0391 family)